jgi:serine protease Do
VGPVVSFAPLVKKDSPSVVNIYSSRTIHEPAGHNPFRDDPLFRQFFGGGNDSSDNQSRTRKEESLGSGVIISPDGYILTANHMVEDADEVKVAINDNKREFTAKIIGKDSLSDVAVLKIDAKDLPAITLADSDQLEVGDIVLAIGNPFGVGQTVTMGIVSALGRNGMGFNNYEDFIQTDAAINPGNSGGALIDGAGRLVGINTAIISSGGGNQGIGFAVPINMARHVMERLIAGGKVTRGFLGVMPDDLTPDLARQFKAPGEAGALVDDVYLSVNGKSVGSAHNLTLTVSDLEPGSTATLKILRDGNPKTISVVLGELPGAGRKDNQFGPTDDDSTTDSLDGVTVDDLTAEIRQQLQIPDNVQGVLVTDVTADSNAAAADLEKGDVIIQINHHQVAGTDDAIRLCKAAKGDHILLKVWHRYSSELAHNRYLTVDNTKRSK